MLSQNFFATLEGFHNFYELTNRNYYTKAPSDWWIVISDVVGSTKAIDEGRYKDVNTVGAATMVALKQAIPDTVFPFVFGGDGASAVIPNEYVNPVRESLAALRKSARIGFNLELRVGMIQIQELEEMGFPLYIAKYLLKDQLPLALFKGGALVQAEKKIKADNALYEVEDLPCDELNLQSLSCRWKPIKSIQGSIITILFWDPKERAEIYQEFLTSLSYILKDHSANPIVTNNIALAPMNQTIALDKKFQSKKLYLWRRFLESTIVPLLFKTFLSSIPWIKNYLDEIPSHSDFRKFDDMVRMVLDCNWEQCRKIEELCLHLRKKHQCCYGTFLSDHALMTCHFDGWDDYKHLHFIDGDQGGYAMAAKQLKNQIKQDQSNG